MFFIITCDTSDEAGIFGIWKFTSITCSGWRISQAAQALQPSVYVRKFGG